MQEHFDWEQAMETTRRSAAAASQNSENAVAGMSKLLRAIDRHSSNLADLSKRIDKAVDLQAQQIAGSKAVLNRTQADNHRSWRPIALGYLAIFVGGVVFGGNIVS
ncbi:hypothetical protein [Shimia isoporae]|uniref:hypothetical protein n=1 Tax=Shimia isoporae TaxID=647720 RepID=UPI001053EDE5|nr:hypothetical protein [Shimia isoporae]